ncbi:MAG: FecR family protein, partial [Candidatus Paceibacterota bacterium]
MKRKHYTIKELVEAPSFRRVVKGIATSDEIETWSNWIEEKPENRVKAKSAITEFVGFHFEDSKLPDVDKKWADLSLKTFGLEKKRSTLLSEKRKKDRKLKRRFLSAAVILIMSLVGFASYYLEDSDLDITQLEQLIEERTITTSNDEKKTLRFSNGSKVVVGSNSLFTYSINLLQNHTINVTLRGEAWFEAESDRESDQPVFAVTTPDGVIKDIGTKFLVTVENNKSRVVLQEGLVEIGSVNNNNSELNNVRFEVGKGEMVEFNRSDILLKGAVNSTFYSSWATGFIEFDQTKLNDFADYVEQRFGVKVQIED